MGDAGGMGVGQGREHIPQHRYGLAQGQLAVSRQPGPQRRALDERPGVVEEGSRPAGAARRDEPRMPQLAAQLPDLLLESG